MARIRSVHPGQWTDEAFVSVSAFARLLAIGLRNEADDNGVFEWKPLGLKMRLLPADNVDVIELLAELAAANIVKRVESGTKSYGLIRNFRRFQRPERPSIQHPIAESERLYIGLFGEPTPTISECSPNLSAEGGGIGEGTGEGEGKGSSESESESSPKGRGSASPSAQPPTPGGKSLKTQAGTRFDLTEAPARWIEFCRSERSDLDPAFLFANFRDHWTAIGALKANWEAAWRKWVRKEWQGKTGPPNGHDAAYFQRIIDEAERANS